MKYKLINTKTNEIHLCDKVTINGFDYYVSDEGVVNPCYFYNKPTNYLGKALKREDNFLVCENIEGFHLLSEAKKVIATNNPNIGIPKVMDEIADGKEIRELAKLSFHQETQIEDFNSLNGKKHFLGFTKGYIKSQETYPFSEEDMIDFGRHIVNLCLNKIQFIVEGELLEWKEQRPKIIYYGTN